MDADTKILLALSVGSPRFVCCAGPLGADTHVVK